MEHDLLAHLNEPQQKAVQTTEGPVLILAGPGSGKTRVITHRIAYLVRVKKVEPWAILAVTFTNRAAQEMRDRLEKLLSKSQAKAMQIGTFHSLSAKILRREPDYLARFGMTRKYVIYDRHDAGLLIKQALGTLDLSDMSIDQSHPPKIAELQECISFAKARMLSPQALAEEAKKDTERLAARVWPRYDQLLRANNAADFDDLLTMAEQALRTQPERLREYQQRWLYLHADEWQDANLPQYKLIRLLAYGTDEHHEGLSNVCVVGDDDQMIYTWRGASLANVIDFERDFPNCTQIILEQNYRSTKTILSAAQEIVRHNQDRKEKQLWTPNPRGELVSLYQAQDDREEARFIARELRHLKDQGVLKTWRDAAILYRMNMQSRALEEALRYALVPYIVIGSRSFYDRKEIKDLIAYLRLLVNPHDSVSLLRIINVPSRKIGKTTITHLQNWAEQQHISLYQAICLIEHHPVLKAPTKQVLFAFGQIITDLLGEVPHLSLPALFDRVIERSNYEAELAMTSSEEMDRRSNVAELRRVAEEFAEEDPETALEEFLEHTALIGGADTTQTGEKGSLAKENLDAVHLITLHAAKGLEYPVVAIIGLDEGSLPHSRAFDRIQLEEERRLAYVGATRARERLYLLRAEQRFVYGETRSTSSSRFLNEIPPELVQERY